MTYLPSCNGDQVLKSLQSTTLQSFFPLAILRYDIFLKTYSLKQWEKGKLHGQELSVYTKASYKNETLS